MKKLILVILISLIMVFNCQAQSTEILPGIICPKMTTAQRFSLVNPQNGMLVFDLDTQSYWVRSNAVWKAMDLQMWSISGMGNNEIKNTNSSGFWSAAATGLSLSSSNISNPPETPENGDGTRLMWIPRRSAFRAGTVYGGQKSWDADSVGLYSTALGYNSTASGHTSIAMGYQNRAKGYQSIAFGYGSKSTNYYSTALGRECLSSDSYCFASGFLCQATTISSVAMGRGSITNGPSSIAIGYFPKTLYTIYNGSVAIGSSVTADNGSIAMGRLNTASGIFSFAMGFQTLASDEKAMAFGYQTTASKPYSIALGFQTKASGNHAISLGHLTEARGTSSIALLRNSLASGANSYALGLNATASGLKAIALGSESLASNESSIALGSGSRAIGKQAIAVGRLAMASGRDAIAIGYNTNSIGYKSIAFGHSTLSSDTSTIAMGFQSVASGVYATAMGNNTHSTGYNTLTMGFETTASGNHAFAMGSQNLATGDTSIVMGQNSTASGTIAIAIGFNSVASGHLSTVMGQNSIASGIKTTAIGSNNLAIGDYSTAVGLAVRATGSNSTAMGVRVTTNNQEGSFVIGDNISPTAAIGGDSLAADTTNRFLTRFENGYKLFTDNNLSDPVKYGVFMANKANSWSSISDSTKKERFLAYHPNEILKSVSEMRVGTWNYKGDRRINGRHWGVMAQDFYHHFGQDQFGTIESDTMIATADFDGVSFAAIKALESYSQQLLEENLNLERQLEIQKAKIEELSKIKEEIMSLKAMLLSTSFE